jgi:hypothetical protein
MEGKFLTQYNSEVTGQHHDPAVLTPEKIVFLVFISFISSKEVKEGWMET